ncbi:hypothetical protein PR202_ga03799 [Eleusine coracana subsp. coracana]|uniref:Protein FAR1-RELATED SEQUENCE n=1 Tax=Eleusine coracana subsp. coracana TaxID=191504 RepID=A0AAV5BPB7_ELECO|nr:hypothetical protein PR202_ga03799 [Eleusine coracana subsp. coracana]
MLDSIAIHSTRFTELEADYIKKDVVAVFTPTIFDLVKQKIDYVSKYVISEILVGFYLTAYVVAMKEKKQRKFHIDCEFTESSLAAIHCSCCNMECDGMPCGHIFYVLNILRAEKLPKCCIDSRWTMGAKSAFPCIQKQAART